MPDGRIEQRQKDLLKVMGDWLKTNGEAVYGTRGGPYLPTDYMVTTRSKNKIYLHLFDFEEEALTLPFAKGVKIEKSYFLDGGTPLAIKQKPGELSITLPEELPDENASIIVLELNTSAEALDVILKLN
jgi:alpha-L-fucosidase